MAPLPTKACNRRLQIITKSLQVFPNAWILSACDASCHVLSAELTPKRRLTGPTIVDSCEKIIDHVRLALRCELQTKP